MSQKRSQAMQAAACTRPRHEDERLRQAQQHLRPGVSPEVVGMPRDASDASSHWKAKLLQALAGTPATHADVDARLAAVFPALPAEVVPQRLSPSLAMHAATAHCYVPTRVELEFLTAFLQVLQQALASGMGRAQCLVSPLSMAADRFVVPAMQALLAPALDRLPASASVSERGTDGEPLLCLSLAAENAMESLLLRMTRALHIEPPARGGQGDRRLECEERILLALAERHIVALVISGIAQRHLHGHFRGILRLIEEIRGQGLVVSLLTTPAIDQLPSHWLAELDGASLFRNSRYAKDELPRVVDRQWAAISATVPPPTGMTQAAMAAFGQRDWIQHLFMAWIEMNGNRYGNSAVSVEAVFDRALAAWKPQLLQWQRLCRQGRATCAEHAWADWVPLDFSFPGRSEL